MKQFALIVIAGLLAGCVDESPVNNTIDQGSPDNMPQIPVPVLTVNESNLTTTSAFVSLSGSLNTVANMVAYWGDEYNELHTLSVIGDWDNFVVGDIGHGAGVITITATNDAGQDTATVDINRLAMATIEVEYGPTSSNAAVNDSVWVDLSDFITAADYEAEGTQHPTFGNVHDAIETWAEAEGHEVVYSYSESFTSFSVDSIDGVGNALSAGAGPYWCFDINGAAAETGISIAKFTPGDVISWYICGTMSD